VDESAVHVVTLAALALLAGLVLAVLLVLRVHGRLLRRSLERAAPAPRRPPAQIGFRANPPPNPAGPPRATAPAHEIVYHPPAPAEYGPPRCGADRSRSS
jgi:hypothetical protein